MIKTNSKEMKQKIRSLINDLFDASSYDREDLNSAPVEEKIAFIAKTCWSEKGFEVKKHYMTYQEMFIDWCQGLPSVIDTALYYCHESAVDLLGAMLEQTEEERNKYSEIEAEKMISYLIYRECANDLFKIAYQEMLT